MTNITTSDSYYIGRDTLDSFVIGTTDENSQQTDIAFVLDRSGRITTPKNTGFDVYVSSNRPFPIQTLATVVFDKVIINIGECYNSTSGIFTAPVEGFYDFDASVFLDDPLSQINNALTMFLKIGSRSYAKICHYKTSLNYGITCDISNKVFMKSLETASIAFQYLNSPSVSLSLWGNPTEPLSFFSGYLLG